MQVESRRSSHTGLITTVGRLEKQLEDLHARRLELLSQIEEGEAPLADAQEKLERELQLRAKVEEELRAARIASDELYALLREHDAERYAVEQRLDAARSALDEARLAAQQVRVRREGVAEQFAATNYEFAVLAAQIAADATVAVWESQLEDTKGKIERPYRYIRADFFMARRFANLEDMNRQLRLWLDTVANARLHGTTGRVVSEHLSEERASLQRLPAGRFDAVLRIERRVSHEGMVSVGGNLYSVPDGTRKRVLEVETTATEVRLYEDHRVVAVHALLQGRGQRSLLPGHRQARRMAKPQRAVSGATVVRAPGHNVARRALDIYEAVAQRLGSAVLVAAPAGAAR